MIQSNCLKTFSTNSVFEQQKDRTMRLDIRKEEKNTREDVKKGKGFIRCQWTSK